MRIYILSMYEEHGAEKVKATTRKDDVVAMLNSYIGTRAPMDGMITDVDDELEELQRALDEDTLGMFDLSRGWGGFHLDVVDAFEVVRGPNHSEV